VARKSARCRLQTGSDPTLCRHSRVRPHPVLIFARVHVDVGRAIGDLVERFAEATGDRQLARGVPAPLVASSVESVPAYPRAASQRKNLPITAPLA
jgi:hypothetical protein